MLDMILVPLDGSALSERAVPYATALARTAHARVTLVRAILAHPFPGTDPTDAQLEVRKTAEAYLDSVAERLRLSGLSVDPHVYYDDAAAAIMDAARAQHADLIVMSTHGRTGLGRWVYGSVADEILRRSEVPVLLVPAACDSAWAPRATCIVLALDGSKLAEQALPAAEALSRLLGAEILLVQVLEYPLPMVTDGATVPNRFDLSAEERAARQYLAGVAEGVRARGLPVATDVVLNPPGVVGQVAPCLADVARQRDAMAIVLATHAREGLARLMLGSVATGIVQRTRVPVLLVRPRGAHGTAAVAPPVVERAAPAAAVVLSAAERELVRRGLTALLHGAPNRSDPRGQPLVAGMETAAVQALLARLDRVEADLVAERAPQSVQSGNP